MGVLEQVRIEDAVQDLNIKLTSQQYQTWDEYLHNLLFEGFKDYVKDVIDEEILESYPEMWIIKMLESLNMNVELHIHPDTSVFRIKKEKKFKFSITSDFKEQKDYEIKVDRKN